MGIIMRHRLSGKLMFYVKGADVVMINKVKPGQRSTCQESCENLAMEGLRTLVITHKLLSDAQYQDFEKRIKKAKSEFVDREAKVQAVIESLESDMDFLAVTGVEDKLQENVLETIETLRQAGIKIWMLTGNKIETAKCIAISTGLKSRKQDVVEISNIENPRAISEAIDAWSRVVQGTMLMIDGKTLARIFTDEILKHKFFETAQLSQTVCVCRCSPT